MTANVQQLLNSFDALPDSDKHEAAVEILRRYAADRASDVSDDALVGLADELFDALDHEETRHAPR
jgi:hypothetical protein